MKQIITFEAGDTARNRRGKMEETRDVINNGVAIIDYCERVIESREDFEEDFAEIKYLTEHSEDYDLVGVTKNKYFTAFNYICRGHSLAYGLPTYVETVCTFYN